MKERFTGFLGVRLRWVMESAPNVLFELLSVKLGRSISLPISFFVYPPIRRVSWLRNRNIIWVLWINFVIGFIIIALVIGFWWLDWVNKITIYVIIVPVVGVWIDISLIRVKINEFLDSLETTLLKLISDVRVDLLSSYCVIFQPVFIFLLGVAHWRINKTIFISDGKLTVEIIGITIENLILYRLWAIWLVHDSAWWQQKATWMFARNVE